MNHNELQAVRAADRLAKLLDVFATEVKREDGFGNIGPSDEFLNTVLPGGPVTQEELAGMVNAIRAAADSKDMRRINEIVGVVGGILGPLKSILGVLG